MRSKTDATGCLQTVKAEWGRMEGEDSAPAWTGTDHGLRFENILGLVKIEHLHENTSGYFEVVWKTFFKIKSLAYASCLWRLCLWDS